MVDLVRCYSAMGCSSKTWSLITDFIGADRDVVDALIKADASVMLPRIILQVTVIN